jgi:uridine kinase
VKECDEDFDRRLSDAVKILADEKGARIIGLTGPTCSGKTTAAKRLISHFSEKGKRVHVISLDDFFKDVFSREELKDVDVTTLDFDSPDTLDTELLDSFVDKLFSTGRAKKPIFDFASGKRIREEEIEAYENDMFVFEGIQVLYPKVAEIIGHSGGSVMYVYPWNDIEVGGKRFDSDFIRLCRRLVRDSNFRGALPEFTFGLWDSVRRNEDINIFPHLDLCDIKIDTTHPYELNILAPYLRKLLSGMSENDAHFEKGRYILEMFEGIEGIDRSVISESSLYNEFV